MWNRKEFKKQGKKHFTKNYVACAVICFVLAFLGCEYSQSATVIHGYDTSINVPENVLNATERLTNMEIFGAEDNAITIALENATTTISYAVKLVGSIKDLVIDNYKGSLILGLIFLIEFVYVFFICNPFKVGSRKFFIENHSKRKAKMGIALEPFRHKSYINIVKTLMLQTLYLFLWLFTIVGYFIKVYEYRMIPYIVADNPEMKTREAFALSKKMMHGYKWEMFKFDLSYLGWYILDVLTLGIVGIFYSNPYKAAATAEIYLKLKSANL